MSVFWAWFLHLAWWQYVLIAYFCGIPVTMSSIYDGIRSGEVDLRVVADAYPHSLRRFWLIVALTAMLAGFLWPFWACRSKWWRRALGLKVPPKREDSGE